MIFQTVIICSISSCKIKELMIMFLENNFALHWRLKEVAMVLKSAQICDSDIGFDVMRKIASISTDFRSAGFLASHCFRAAVKFAGGSSWVLA